MGMVRRAKVGKCCRKRWDEAESQVLICKRPAVFHVGVGLVDAIMLCREHAEELCKDLCDAVAGEASAAPSDQRAGEADPPSG